MPSPRRACTNCGAPAHGARCQSCYLEALHAAATRTKRAVAVAESAAGLLMGLPAGPDALRAYWAANKASGYRTCAAELGVSYGWARENRPADRDPGRPGRPRAVRVAPTPRIAPTPRPAAASKGKPLLVERLASRLQRDERSDGDKLYDRMELIRAIERRVTARRTRKAS